MGEKNHHHQQNPNGVPSGPKVILWAPPCITVITCCYCVFKGIIVSAGRDCFSKATLQNELMFITLFSPQNLLHEKNKWHSTKSNYKLLITCITRLGSCLCFWSSVPLCPPPLLEMFNYFSHFPTTVIRLQELSALSKTFDGGVYQYHQLQTCHKTFIFSSFGARMAQSV